MKRPWGQVAAVLALGLLTGACYPALGSPARLIVPTYVPRQQELSLAQVPIPAARSCLVHAVDLLGAWVAAGTPEQDSFPFQDIGGQPCHATYSADIQPLFTQPNLWYPGALSCRTCHGPDVNTAYARMDLSTYQGILAGSGRASASEKGEDILGGGNWQSAMLFEHLRDGEMPPNGPAGRDPRGPTISAGTPD